MNSKKKILIVEDRPNWADFIRSTLDEDYYCDQANTAIEAHKLINTKRYNLIIVDPNLDPEDTANHEGITLIRTVRKKYPNMPFIIISGNYSNEEIQESFPYENGVPFFDKHELDDIKLIQTIQQLLNQKKVLIVEDEETWNKMHQSLLVSFSVDIHSVATFTGALGEIRHNMFSLAVVDLSLKATKNSSNLDGVFLLDHLLGKRIPVLVVTEYFSLDLVETMYNDYNVVRVIEKSDFNIDDFKEFVNRILNSGHNPWKFLNPPKTNAERRDRLVQLVDKLLKNTQQKDLKRVANRLGDHHKEQKELGLSPKYNAFISYASEDEDFAQQLYTDLKNMAYSQNLDIFFAKESIKIGDSVVEKIEQALININYFILVLSKNTSESEWVRNERETVLYYKHKGKQIKIIPIIIGDVEIPPLLVSNLHIDFQNDYQKGLQKLIKTLTNET